MPVESHSPQWISFANLFKSPLKIEVDGMSEGNSAYSIGTLTFGTGGVPDAELIMHELGHAIQDAQVPDLLANGGSALRAISEGFGDYWATSLFADRTSSAWFTFFDEWDGVSFSTAITF
jgi:hypothetical protein